jgi:hypothetical protein
MADGPAVWDLGRLNIEVTGNLRPRSSIIFRELRWAQIVLRARVPWVTGNLRPRSSRKSRKKKSVNQADFQPGGPYELNALGGSVRNFSFLGGGVRRADLENPHFLAKSGDVLRQTIIFSGSTQDLGSGVPGGGQA